MLGPHDKIIANAAKALLGPLGFRRKGQSRAWIADHGWWATIVEFQPSALSKGSYLNVAAHWLWSGQDHLSFDFGGRVAEHIEYLSDTQFAPAIIQLSEAAVSEARRLAECFISIDSAAEVLIEEEQKSRHRSSGGWTAYHAGVSAALTGQADTAAQMFERVSIGFAQPDSVLALAAKDMANLQPDELRRHVSSLIASHRAALRLPALTEVPF